MKDEMTKHGFAAVYIPANFEATWEEFKRICEREGKTINQHFIDWISHYVEVHKVGNPQTLIENGDKPKTLPLFRTCRFGYHLLNGGEFVCKKDGISRTVEICELKNKNGHCYHERETEKV